MVPDIFVMQNGFPHPTDTQLHPFQRHWTDGNWSLENQMQTSIDSTLFCPEKGIPCDLRCFGVSKGLVCIRLTPHKIHGKPTTFWRPGRKSQGTSECTQCNFIDPQAFQPLTAAAQNVNTFPLWSKKRDISRGWVTSFPSSPLATQAWTDSD